MHSAGLIVYSVCTFLIILEILLLLFIYGMDTNKQNPYRVWQLIIALLQAILEIIAVVLRSKLAGDRTLKSIWIGCAVALCIVIFGLEINDPLTGAQVPLFIFIIL